MKSSKRNVLTRQQVPAYQKRDNSTSRSRVRRDGITNENREESQEGLQLTFSKLRQTSQNMPIRHTTSIHQPSIATTSLWHFSNPPFGSFWAAQLGYPPRQLPENSQASLWIPVEGSHELWYLTIPKMYVNHLETSLWWKKNC